ncbi:MAG: phasin family protein [Anaerolineae bacterium]
MAEEIEIEEEAVPDQNSTLLTGLRRVLLAGVGAVALAQEEIEDFVNKLVERGEIAEKDGRQLVNDIMKRRREKAQKAQESLDNRIENLLDRMNIPTRKDIETLSAKISMLAKKVDELKKKSK